LTDRIQLKAHICHTHSLYQPKLCKRVPLCPWCHDQIIDQYDLHEFLVKRSAVNKRDQDLIMVPENVVVVHHRCHMAFGQTKEMARRCLEQACKVLSPTRVGPWYVALWKKHNLSVPTGLLIPPKDCPLSLALTYIDKGLQFRGHSGPSSWKNEEGVDARSLTYKRWQGKSPGGLMKGKIGGVTFSWDLLRLALDEGYWLNYLEGIVG